MGKNDLYNFKIHVIIEKFEDLINLCTFSEFSPICVDSSDNGMVTFDGSVDPFDDSKKMLNKHVNHT